MQPQTLPDRYRVTFDVLAGIEPLTFPASTTADEITAQVVEAFEVAGVEIDVKVKVDLTDGVVTVANEDGDVFEHGSITRVDEQPPAQPDYWLTLADELRLAADRIAALAGTPAPPSSSGSASLYVATSVLRSLSGEMTPIIDRIAATFGVGATDAPIGAGSGNWEHKAAARVGTLDVAAYAFIPTPEDAEKAALRAELETLRAQLAEGGDR